jgi:membrane fusion protein, multidrug efflux system
MMPRQVAFIVVALCLLIGGGYGLMQYLSGLKKPQKQRISETAKIFVQTSVVKLQTVQTQIVTYGRVESAKPVEIVAEVAGRLLRADLPLQVGQKVRAGQVLFRINNAEAILNLQAQKSNYLRDIALILPDLKIDYSDNYAAWQDYFKSLSVEKPLTLPPTPKSDKEKTFIAAKGINTSYYTIKSMEAQLEKFTATAPFQGIISDVYMQSGSSANPGARVLRLLRTDDLELRIPIEVSDINWVKIGTPVRVFSENKEKQWQGKVVRINEIVNPTTQSLDVFVAIANPNQIYEGMYLRAELEGGVVKDAIEVPRRSLFDQDKVYTVFQDSILKERQVRIHKLNPETAVISGLEDQTPLVVEPLINAFDNMRVTAMEAKK